MPVLRLPVAEGIVSSIEDTDAGLWRLRVDSAGGVRRALLYAPPLPEPSVGDRVVLHTGAVDLGLGTGGWDFVMHVLGKTGSEPSDRPSDRPSGHMVKLRYTPWQTICLSVEEEASPHHDAMRRARDVEGMPTVVVGLHSQLAPAAAALRLGLGAGGRVVYVMTDDAALPLAFSDGVRRLRRARLLNGVVTTGDAFGGDVEAMTVFSGLLAARYVLEADAVVVGPGPGLPGTATPFGTTAVHGGQHADAVSLLGGRPVVAPRLSFADERPRHRGISHHTLTAFGLVAQRRCTIVLPPLPSERRRLVEGQIKQAGLHRHRIVVESRGEDALQMLAQWGIPLRSMGRDAVEEGPLFLAAAGAGWVAADMARDGGPNGGEGRGRKQ